MPRGPGHEQTAHAPQKAADTCLTLSSACPAMQTFPGVYEITMCSHSWLEKRYLMAWPQTGTAGLQQAQEAVRLTLMKAIQP